MKHIIYFLLILIIYLKPGYSASDQKSLNILVFEKFKPIVARYYEKIILAKKLVNTSDGSQILSHGYWYKNDYLEILDLYINNNSKWAKNKKLLFDNYKYNNGYIASPYFTRKGQGHAYYLRKYARPSLALESLEDYLVFIDCGIAQQLAYYLAALEYLGQEIFDQYFLEHDNNKPFFSSNTHDTKIYSLLESVIININENNIGSFLYLRNHPFYIWKNPYGYGQGFNLFCSGTNYKGEKLYTGLGLPPEGLSIAQIKDILVEDFNRTHRLAPPRGIFGFFNRSQYSLWLFWQDKKISSVDDQTYYSELEEHFMRTFKTKSQARKAHDELMSFAMKRNNHGEQLQLGLKILQKIKRISKAALL